MYHCLELAALGAGNTAPNPMVGAVLVNDDKIIGEGYHQKYGEAHAEVSCINSVKLENQKLISQAVLYVSLEPCVHFGKTPPCVDLIIQNRIPKVIIGCRDPFDEVNGKGIEKLKAAGVEVLVGILENQCKELNKRFFTFHIRHRPYIILKWAETADGKIAHLNPSPAGEGTFKDSKRSRLIISNEITNRLVHKWRTEEASVLVGTNTALYDNPELTARHWPGLSPTRLVVDMNLRLPVHLKILNREHRTIIFNKVKQKEDGNLFYCLLNESESLVHQIINVLYQMKIHSVLVEGGARLLQSFIDEGIWDEVRIIRNEKVIINNGLASPSFFPVLPTKEMIILNDKITFYKN